MPSIFRELNLKAFDQGYEYGLTAQAGGPPELEEGEYAQQQERASLSGFDACDPVVIEILRDVMTEK